MRRYIMSMHVFMYISVYTLCTCMHTVKNRYKQIKHSFIHLNKHGGYFIRILKCFSGSYVA